MFRTDLLSIIRRLNTVFTGIGVCHTSYVDCLLARSGRNCSSILTSLADSQHICSSILTSLADSQHICSSILTSLADSQHNYCDKRLLL